MLAVDLLGPLALRVDGAPVAVPGRQRRVLLALLALAGGRPVGVGRLIDALWEDAPPENAEQALYNHVSRLRGHLRPHGDRLERVAAGYRLRLEPGELDVDFVRGLAGSDPAGALAQWRGAALEEFRSVPDLEIESVALDELRLRLVDDVLEQRLVAGDGSVTADARAAAAAAPLRERTAQLLVRALAADGRAAEALAEAATYRRRLADETGLDPSPELAVLEQQVAAGPLRHRVARPTGPLVGRTLEREDVLRLLADNATVTVTGPGGVGKTRLALEIAAELSASGEEDVAVVALAAVDRADRLCQAIASTLGLRTSGHVAAADVAAALAHRRLLLVLDNCEHLADGCRDVVATVRQAAPGVRVLATSRVTLHVPGEYVVRLQPFSVPRDVGDLASLRRQPAVRAFVEHARRRLPDFDVQEADAADVVEVLRRLDGLPLGIELAARQVSVMPVREVRRRLDRALDLATGRAGADDARQRTLRATIDSSYQLLAPAERALLLALAPFPGGVDLATVESIAPGPDDPVDLLHRLVDASLLSADPVWGRYRLLYTVRGFLLDELAGTGGLDAAQEVFVARCVALAEELGDAAIGPDEVAADRRLRTELDNLRAAWDLAAARGDHDARIQMTTALGDAMTWRDLRELWAWARELAGDPAIAAHPRLAEVLGTAAEAARLVGDLDEAARLADATMAAVGPDAGAAYLAWSVRGSVAHFRGDFTAARDHWVRAGESRGRTAGAWLASAALASSYGGDGATARTLLDRAHAADERTRCPSQIAFATYVEGELRVTREPEESIPFYVEAIATARGCGARFVEGVAGVALASARERAGDVSGAAAQYAELLTSWQRSGHSTQLWTTARNAAGLLARAGRRHTAALALVCADLQPGAAAVSPAIARHSGRQFVPLTDLVAAEEVAGLRAEVARLSPAGVLDLLRQELAGIG
ncbi:BTAD domain-containing putative transcriptional regulator [Nocardioides caricicola]|uniref:BTAD domain-containing putative transcriptional regulator n=1 Tax=Nocardioides caricicola TaxID=634770 RepID=A0ABW0MWA3_9ACTN